MDNDNSLLPLYERVGNNISFLRTQRNLTQEQIAVDLDISQAMVSQYETGKRKPSLTTLNRIADYFDISLQEFIFKDFYKEQLQGNDSTLSIVETDPIFKCSNSTYYCYYIKEQSDGENKVIWQIDSFCLNIGNPITSHSAKANILFFKSGYQRDSVLEMDGKYAYITSHEFRKDFFLHLTFFYYRDRPSPKYLGGIGLLQRFDYNLLPVCQYCIISRNAIGDKKLKDLTKFLTISEGNSPIKNSHRKFSSSAVLRLTKALDASVFSWLKSNKYT